MNQSEKHYFAAGQLWEYHTLKGEEETKLLILKVESLKDENIVHVTIFGNPNAPMHMPFAESAIRESVTKLCMQAVNTPDYEEGYSYWRRSFEEGNAGIYRITVSEAFKL